MKRVSVAAVAFIAALAMSAGAANAAPVSSAALSYAVTAGSHDPDPKRGWGVWDKFCEAFPRLC